MVEGDGRCATMLQQGASKSSSVLRPGTNRKLLQYGSGRWVLC